MASILEEPRNYSLNVEFYALCAWSASEENNTDNDIP
jgi:hypothetical protein